MECLPLGSFPGVRASHGEKGIDMLRSKEYVRVHTPVYRATNLQLPKYSRQAEVGQSC